MTSHWWERAAGYEIYLRSFSDSNGDGIGDLSGIRSRLDHLERLGVDLLWLTPFYPSPMVDFGYDVADYTDVDPRFGSLDDFDELLHDAHRRGMRIVVDIVPNHSSDQHAWFQSARSGRQSPHRDWYVWADPAPDGGPPNNWIGCFGGPAWSLDEASGQYYCHLFFPEQPDLNWSNPAVLDAFDDILRFWLDRGVDGFRVDVAHALVKDEQLRSNPRLRPWDPEADRWTQWESFEHRHDILQPGVLDVFRRWRRIVDSYGAFLIGETYVLDPVELDFMLTPDGLHAGFYFGLMHTPWEPDSLLAAVRSVADGISGTVGWAISSHDDPRPATRFGGGELGLRRAMVLSVLLFGLPGVPFLFQGEELGLEDGQLGPADRADPVGADIGASRDGCRTPVPWEPGVANLGFSTGAPWLPMGGRADRDTAAAQWADPSAAVHFYRELVAWRRSIPDPHAAVEWLVHTDPSVIGYRRDAMVVVVNVGDAELAVPLDRAAPSVVLEVGAVRLDGRSILLGAASAAVVELGP